MTPLHQFKGVPTDVVHKAEGKQFISCSLYAFLILNMTNPHYSPGIAISISHCPKLVNSLVFPMLVNLYTVLCIISQSFSKFSSQLWSHILQSNRTDCKLKFNPSPNLCFVLISPSFLTSDGMKRSMAWQKTFSSLSKMLTARSSYSITILFCTNDMPRMSIMSHWW